MKLDGFGIAGFRSFSPEMVFIGDLSKVNIFIGKNNSGKSNILRFVQHLAKVNLSQQHTGFSDLDYCVGAQPREIDFAIQIKPGALHEKIATFLPGIGKRIPEFKDQIWFRYRCSNLEQTDRDPALQELALMVQKHYSPDLTNELTAKHCGYSGGGNDQRARDLARRARLTAIPEFQAYMIDAFRRITAETGDTTLNGRGLIGKLRELQSPALKEYTGHKATFTKITSFLRELLGEPDAYMDIPAKEDVVLVSIRDKVLPLDSLGTGIHEIIILAAAVTIIDDAVVCLEEPEIHLHPDLQKKFLRYILRNTNNQYLIATHSNAFFDLGDVNIYHCRLEGGYTQCELVQSDRAKWSILRDLGYNASDILQANSVIWVEGPSDRVYLNHWLRGKDASLIEGIHYSIMFYGGRLLSHLAFDSNEVGQFIQLSRINQNSAIVVDSDKTGNADEINQTKQRVLKDFRDNGCFAWLTTGREIENYLPEKGLNEAVVAVHPKKARHISCEQFARVTQFDDGTEIDKVAVSKRIAEAAPDYSMLDLNNQIDGLVEFIRGANGAGA